MEGGDLIWRTIVHRGMPLKMSLDGLCGLHPPSAMVKTPCTPSAIDLCTTKKSYTLPLQVGEREALMTASIFRSHPVSSSWCGVQFQSPDSIKGSFQSLDCEGGRLEQI